MAAKGKRGLGRGLDALLRPQQVETIVNEMIYISVDRIITNRYQPRRSFNEESLRELADSIRSNGVLEPLLVRPADDDFELVAGERRLRAARLAELTEVPVIVHQFDDRQAAEIALVENLQREDLNPIEEATAFRRLLQEFKLTQEELAERIGRSRSHLANTLRLLQLPQQIQDYLIEGALEMGHARCMLSLPMDKQLWLAQEVLNKKMTVRQTEARARSLGVLGAPRRPKEHTVFPEQRYWENKLKQQLQTNVRIHSEGESGKIEIPFYDKDDMERLLALLLGTETL